MRRRNFLKGIAAAAGAAAVAQIPVYGSSPSSGKRQRDGMRADLLPELECDVIVVGAGPGGIPAAIRAAQNGAKVILVEEDMAIGGAPLDMYVTTMFGGPRIGLAEQIEQELLKGYGLYNYEAGTQPKGWRFFLPSAFSQVLTRHVKAEDNISLMCGTPVVGVHVKESGNRNRVTGVKVFRGGKMQDIFAHVTIDATGTGVVADMAGCECMYGSEAKSDYNEQYGFEEANNKVQRCTQMFISERIRKDAIFPAGFKGSAAEDGYIGANRQPAEELARRATGIFFHWGQTIDVDDTRDPVLLAEAQRTCLEKYRDRFEQLHEAGFAVHIAPKLGVRECRRVKGEYVITATDITEGNKPDDTIARARYNMDCWGIKGMLQVPTKEYGIPYRSLIPLNTEGLLTAGRVISGTRLAHSSYRVQRICWHIGEAAGTAAAMAAVEGADIRDVEVAELQTRLKGYGLI